MNLLASIEFHPALDADKLSASRERHAAAGVKVYIKVRDALPATAIFAGESEPLSSIFEMKQGATGAEHHGSELVAFGVDPTKVDIHDRAAVQEVLRRFLPDVSVEQVIGYEWHLDPYSLGTWCVLRKGQMTRYLEALREPHGNVHFAGGDLALGWRGFIDGAIESGNRAAHHLIARLEARSRPLGPVARQEADSTGRS